MPITQSKRKFYRAISERQAQRPQPRWRHDPLWWHKRTRRVRYVKPKAALAFVQAASNSTATNACAVTVTTTAGNMLVLFVQQSLDNTSTVTITDSSGTGTWTQTASGYVSNGTTNRTAMFVKPNSAAVTSVTATWNTGGSPINEVIVFEISGG